MNVTSADFSKKLGAAMSLDEAKEEAALKAVAKAIQTATQQGKTVDIPNVGQFPGGDAADLAPEIGAAIGDPGTDAGSVISALAEALRIELLRINAVTLDGVGTFEVKRVAPKMVNDFNRYRLTAPPAATFSFNPAPALGKATFKPNDDFKQAVNALATTTLLIVVPSVDFFSETLVYYFEKSGWTTKVVTSVAEALRQIQTLGAYAVVIDNAVPEASRLSQTLKATRESNRIPLFLLNPKGFNPEAPGAFAVQGDAHLSQPFEIRKMITMLESEMVRAAEASDALQQQITFMFPSEESQIEAAFDYGHKIFEQSGLTDEGQVALAAAFREAVGNANQHGNKYRKEKKIDILYLLDRDKITIVVKDMGEGFDHQKYVRHGKAADAITAARERGAQGRMGGLGIMLMLKCCEKIEYNQKGNAITLTKSLKTKPGETAAAMALR
jgi:anti-sigma regulatory factor (Ser/Thr protein kinase)/nucleoid DNA-binding protein